MANDSMECRKWSTPPAKLFDIHIHLMGLKDQDDEFLAFAKEWKMRFAASCLGPDGPMLIDPTLEECVRANDMVLKLMDQNPDLAHGFCYVNPLHGQAAVDEVRRCISHGMVGVKLWIACKCSDPRSFPIVEEAINLGVPVLQHSYIRPVEYTPGESTPDDVAVLAAKYPQARIIMAHMGLIWRQGVNAVKDYPNITVDTCGLDPENGCVEYAVNQLGVDRVVYGSDAPGRDILCQIGNVAAANISDSDKEKLFHLNAERLIVSAPSV